MRGGPEGRGLAMQELNKLDTLREIIDKGQYIVALCGSGMIEECGLSPLKEQDRADSQ